MKVMDKKIGDVGEVAVQADFQHIELDLSLHADKMGVSVDLVGKVKVSEVAVLEALKAKYPSGMANSALTMLEDALKAVAPAAPVADAAPAAAPQA